jgi:hypothetical protein
MAFGNILFNGSCDIVLPVGTITRYFNTGAGFNTNSAQQLASNYRTFPSMLTGARNQVKSLGHIGHQGHPDPREGELRSARGGQER